jgi:hypothetical protein
VYCNTMSTDPQASKTQAASPSRGKPEQILYIATSRALARHDLYEVGGVKSVEHLCPRMCSYDPKKATDDDMYYAKIYVVHDYEACIATMRSIIPVQYRVKVVLK